MEYSFVAKVEDFQASLTSFSEKSGGNDVKECHSFVE